MSLTPRERIAGAGRAHAADRDANSTASKCGSNASACRPAARSSCAARPTGCCSSSEDERKRGVVAFSSGNHARGVAIAAQAARHPRDHRHAVRRAGGESRGHARRGRGDHLLRPPQREPRGNRRADCRRKAARPSCRASTIRTSSPGRARSGSRSSSSWREVAAAAIVVPCGGGGLASGIALACPDAEIVMRRARRLGRHAPLAGARRDRAGRRRMRRRRCAMRFRRRAFRRSPSASCRSAARRRSPSARKRSRRRCAWPGSEHQLVVEPGGAVALAALLVGQGRAVGRNGGGAVGREHRSGASRADRRRAA